MLRRHEFKTVVFLTEQGLDVELLPPKQTKGSKTADLRMNHLEWEMKAPTKLGKYTIDHAERAALKQSNNLIFDLRNLRNTGTKALAKLQKDFETTKKWRRLIIITKDGEILTPEK